jgi:hypothetical protein
MCTFFRWLCAQYCPSDKDSQQGGQNTVSFTNDEVNFIETTRQNLRHWLDLAGAGVIGAPEQQNLKSDIMDTMNVADKLYQWYVPPFQVNPTPLTEGEIQSVIKDVQSKGGMQTWLRLDGTYYAADLDTIKKIIEWDWTDTRKYITDTFDCDKFATYFKSRMAIDFRINAIGIILDYSAGHAYNLIIVKDAQGVRWYLYEPQNDKMFTYDQRDKQFYTMQSYVLLL